MKMAVVVGVADHCGWAVLVTTAPGGIMIDRRRVELVEKSLPKLPHHHECQRLPLKKAIELVERVRSSANVCATKCLEELTAVISVQITGIAIRKCPVLPQTIEERITNYRAQNVADTVMYRHALADAAKSRGWSISWYDSRLAFTDAGRILGQDDIQDFLGKVGKSVGPPWRQDHRVAMAAAIAAIGK